jgi:hypothetical protein
LKLLICVIWFVIKLITMLMLSVFYFVLSAKEVTVFFEIRKFFKDYCFVNYESFSILYYC